MIKNEQPKSKYSERVHKILIWHSFLRISPSYQLAIRYRSGDMTRAERSSLPASFELVLHTYNNFGDIWEFTPQEWMLENAYEVHGVLKTKNTPKMLSSLLANNAEKTLSSLQNYLQGDWVEQGCPAELIFAIPVNIKKSAIYEVIANALDNYKTNTISGSDTEHPVKVDKFQMLSTKVRLGVLRKINQLVILKAHKPGYQNWQLADQLGISPALVADIKKSENLKGAASNNRRLQLSDRETGTRLIVSSVIGRDLRKAFLLAENAAQGRFPDFSDLGDGMGKSIRTHFDFQAITNGLKREYFKMHGKRPEKQAYKEGWYQVSDDNWWEENWFAP